MELTKKFKNINILFLLKTGIGSAAAIILADRLGIAYSPSAGIITLLTIQNTKKETLFIALRRVIAFVLAVAITYCIFQGFGYHAMAFGIIIFLFVAVCLLSGLKDGISMNAVLMTHFLIEKSMNMQLIINEAVLLVIGMGIGIIINLIMPRYRERIRKEQIELEEDIKNTLRSMSVLLKEKDACLIQENNASKIILNEEILKPISKSEVSYQKKENRTSSLLQEGIKGDIISQDINADFSGLEASVDRLLKRAYEEAGNTLLSNTKYRITYLEMRKLQVGVLKDIVENIEQIPVVLQQTFPIAGFMEEIATSFHELNNAAGLLEKLEVLKAQYRRERLPQTREEFEYRAILFQILKELEYFLLLKRNFMLELEKGSMKSYWI